MFSRFRWSLFAALVGLLAALAVLALPRRAVADSPPPDVAAALAAQPLPGSEPAEALDAGAADVAPAPLVAPAVDPATGVPASIALPKTVPTSIEMDAWAQWGLLALQAVRSKDYQFLIGLLLIVAMLGLRKLASYVENKKDGWMGDLAGFFNTQFGGTLLLFVTAALGGIGSAALAHVPWSAGLFLDVGKMSLMAAGGWTALVKPGLELLAKWWAKRQAAKVAPGPAAPPTAGFISVWLALAIFALALLAGMTARAATPAAGQVSAFTLAAATATKVTTTPLVARRAVAVANCDTVRIFCGFSSSVSATGWPVEPGCGKESFDLGAEQDLWCYSVAGTAANAVRVVEIR